MIQVVLSDIQACLDDLEELLRAAAAATGPGPQAFA